MLPYFITAVAGGLVGFFAGIVFSKTVFSEATVIKAHITSEIAKLRSDIRAKL